MPKYFQLIYLAFLLLVSSCAQVGTLTGGNKDEVAPRVRNVNPPANSVRFTDNKVSIEFDEYIKLNNPQQNVYLIPNDAKTEVFLEKKTVTVSWKESLKPNTTYTLYLNGAVSDTHEGNDSLMSYVFSTGDFIDSISYKVRAVDAWTGKPLSKIMVALYEDSLTDEAIYFGQTDVMGEVTIQHLRSADYFLKAFSDDDRNLKVSPGEWRGFNAERLKLQYSIEDTLPIRMFKQANTKTNFKLCAPGVVSISGNYLNETTISLLNGPTLEEQFLQVNSDSLLYFLPSDTVSKIQFVTNFHDKIDTVAVNVMKRDHQARLTLKSSLKRAIRPSEKIEFELNDRVLSLNIAKIKLIDALSKDTITLISGTFAGNKIILDFDRKGHSKVDIIFNDGAFSTTHQKSSSPTTITSEFLGNRDFGSIRIKTWQSKEPLLLFVYFQGALERVTTIPEEQEILLEEMLPGTYRFKVVEDVNRNGKWDVGDISAFVQPENLYEFEGPTVRANWETEVQLSIDQK